MKLLRSDTRDTSPESDLSVRYTFMNIDTFGSTDTKLKCRWWHCLYTGYAVGTEAFESYGTFSPAYTYEDKKFAIAFMPITSGVFE
jgi:hypothetical protein